MVTRWRAALDGVATVAMILTSGVLIWTALSGRAQRACGSQAPEAPLPSEPVSLEGAATLGARTARIAIIEFSDFACPFCAQFVRETLPMLKRDYVDTGKVLLAFRHLPLEKRHPAAMRAAEAVECAGNEGRFWEMHRHVFENPARLDTGDLNLRARTLGLDPARFRACVDGGLARAEIRKDAAGAAVLRVTGTPTFLLGALGKSGSVQVMSRISGAPPYSTFSKMLDILLAGRNSGQ